MPLLFLKTGRSLVMALGLAIGLHQLQATAHAQEAEEGTSPHICFFAKSLNSWREVNDTTVNLRVGVSDVYQAKLLGKCHDLKWVQKIGIESRGSDWICSGPGATLIVRTQGMTDRCPVVSLTKMSKEEANALPATEKP